MELGCAISQRCLANLPNLNGHKAIHVRSRSNPKQQTTIKLSQGPTTRIWEVFFSGRIFLSVSTQTLWQFAQNHGQHDDVIPNNLLDYRPPKFKSILNEVLVDHANNTYVSIDFQAPSHNTMLFTIQLQVSSL